MALKYVSHGTRGGWLDCFSRIEDHAASEGVQDVSRLRLLEPEDRKRMRVSKFI